MTCDLNFNLRSWANSIYLSFCSSKDELKSDVLVWTPAYGQAKAGRPARTYIQQLCEDMGCSPEDLLEAMNDREEWRERVGDIRASGTTWGWWWWWFVIVRKRSNALPFGVVAIEKGAFYYGRQLYLLLFVKVIQENCSKRAFCKF